jgi:hypothetical protein
MKRLLSLILSVVMIISITPAMSFAAQNTLTAAEKDAILTQRRNIAESHMRKITSMIWRCEVDTLFAVPDGVLPESASENFLLVAGRLYQGLPYSFSGGSYNSWEELVTGPDESGVYCVPDLNWQMISGGGSVARFGTDCSGAVTQAWSQIGASIRLQATKDMCPKYGYLRVGDYTASYDKIDDADIQALDPQVMYAAYAQLQKADALVHNGHVRMAVSVDVVYNKDGTINGEESTVTYLEQTRQLMREDVHHYDETLAEDVWELCGVDLKIDFATLYKYSYQPITCLELIDATAGPETPAVTDSLPDEDYGFENLFAGTLTTKNWVMDTVQMTITDRAGATVQQAMIAAPRGGVGTRYKVPMSMFVTEAPTRMLGYISPDTLKAGDYHCKVVCRLTTGQEFTVRDFDFAVTATKNDIHNVKIDFSQGTIHDCPVCGTKKAQWKPLTADYVGSGNGPATGHYYLPESLENNTGYISFEGVNVCLHLNGKNITSTERALTVSGSSVLNIMGNGVVTGTKPENSNYGAAINCFKATVNLYGGTYRHNKINETNVTQRPVVAVRSDGTINMYDGALIEGDSSVKRPNVLMYKGRFNMYGGEVVNGYGTNGGNFLVGYDGTAYNLNYLCVYGGKIENGLATGMGGNIYAVYDSFVYIYGGEISGGEAAKGGNLAISGGGNIRLLGGSVTNGTATSLGSGIYGTNTKTSVTSKTEIDEATGKLKVQNLYLKDCGVVISADALYEGEIYTENNTYVRFDQKDETDITLHEDLDQLSMRHDLNVDLNGFHILNLETNGYTLTVRDSATDDYDVSDGIYGTVPANADIQIPQGYIPVTIDGKTSFHKYEIILTDLVVNTKKVGLTYSARFLGDAVIKDGICAFGVAVRANCAPDETSILQDPTGRTHMSLSPDAWQNRKNVQSVYVIDIMDSNETTAKNNARAQIPVYGIGYIRLNDGTMLFGNSHGESLLSAMQYVDSLWDSTYLDDAERTDLTAFCKTWAAVMEDWAGLTHIKNAAGIPLS